MITRKKRGGIGGRRARGFRAGVDLVNVDNKPRFNRLAFVESGKTRGESRTDWGRASWGTGVVYHIFVAFLRAVECKATVRDYAIINRYARRRTGNRVNLISNLVFRVEGVSYLLREIAR